MTVKELFLSVSFKQIVEAFARMPMYSSDSSVRNSLSGYKEAYDAICNLEPTGDGGEVTFDVESENAVELLTCYNVEGDLWENVVTKTIVPPDDNAFTDAELAGAILWGMTFYGFSRHERWNPYKEYFTPYGEKAERLERKLYLPYIRDKREKRIVKSKKMPFGISFSFEVWEQIRYGKKHQNRAKRKRYYRLKRRIALLKRLDKRQHLIDTLRQTTDLADSDLEGRIMSTGSIYETWRESHTYGKSLRIEYLEDLFTNYERMLNKPIADCEEMVVVAYTSIDSPLTDEELVRLQALLSGVAPKVTFLRGVSDECGFDISLQFVEMLTCIPDDDDD